MKKKGNRQLSLNDIREILTSSDSPEKIGKRIGYSGTTVRRVLEGVTYTDMVAIVKKQLESERVERKREFYW